MSSIALILSILFLIDWSSASNNSGIASKFHNIKSRFSFRTSTIRDAVNYFSNNNHKNGLLVSINGNSQQDNPKKGIKRKQSDDRVDDFDRIFAKWQKRPANLNCAWAPKSPADRRRDPQKLRIASYNAEWLYLFGGSGSIKCPGASCPWEDVSKARDHIFQTLSLFENINADIIHLNEIEDCRILRLLMDLMPENHGYKAYVVPGTDTMTGQNVGILTRIDPLSNLVRTEDREVYPIANSNCGAKSSSKFLSSEKKRNGTMGLSKHYLTHFQVGDLKILWAGAHFIAHPGNIARCFRREAQAHVLSNFVDKELGSDEEIIITGDFNDHDGEVQGANSALPRSTVLRILKSNQLGLKSAASFVCDQMKRYTSWHDVNGNCLDDGNNEHSLIDHVLMSPKLANRIVSVWMDHNKTVSCHKRTSDHWPLIIDMQI